MRLALFVFGVVLALSRGEARRAVFPLLFVAYTVIVTVLLYSNARLRMSMDVPFLVLAAVGLKGHAELFARARAERAQP